MFKSLIVSICLIASCCVLGLSQTPPYWEELNPNWDPSIDIHKRGWGDMVYEEHNQRFILFGGWRQIENEDRKITKQECVGGTWVFQDNTWVKMDLNEEPEARWGHRMVYDSTNQRIILFGGENDHDSVYGDTWEFKSNKWERISTEGPDPRSGHALAYDSYRDRILLFGGRKIENKKRTYLGDTWVFDGKNWDRKSQVGPSARRFHSMIYNKQNGKTILLGGERYLIDSTKEYFNDMYVWDWNGELWNKIQEEEDWPDKRSSANQMVYNSENNKIVLLGGRNNEGIYKNDIWEYDSKEGWKTIPIFDPIPSERHFAYMAYNSTDNYILLFGGGIGNSDNWPTLEDTWKYVPDQNKTPVAQDIEIETVQDTPVQILLKATDLDDDPLTFEIIDKPEHGTLDESNLPDVIYTPKPGFIGTDYFTFKANDGVGDSNIATVTINVISPPYEITVQRNFLNIGCYQPGKPFTVSIQASMDSAFVIDSLIVEETIPIGLTPFNISKEGFWNESTRTIRWFVFSDFNAPFTYEVTPTEFDEQEFSFLGIASYLDGGNEIVIPIDEKSTIHKCLCKPHIVDIDKDFVISNSELLNAAGCWKNQCNPQDDLDCSPYGESCISNRELLEAASLWKKGGNYCCDDNGNYVSDCPKSISKSTAKTQPVQQNPLITSYRVLPQCDSNQPWLVTLSIVTNDNLDALIVEETVPDGWDVTDVSNGGEYVASLNTIRWFLLSDFNTDLTYRIQPSGEFGKPFTGQLSWFDNGSEQSSVIEGDQICEGDQTPTDIPTILPTPTDTPTPTVTPTVTPNPVDSNIGGGTFEFRTNNITVPVKAYTIPEIYSVQFEIIFDPEFLMYDESRLSKENSMIASWTLYDCKFYEPNRLRIVAVAGDVTPANGTGILLNLPFHIQEGVENGSKTELFIENKKRHSFNSRIRTNRNSFLKLSH
jgi:hypothetical protein